MPNARNPAFHEYAGVFNAVFSKRRYPDRQATAISEIMARLASPGSNSVVEIGCGAGDLCAALSRAGYSVTGIDRSPEMLEIARASHGESTNLQWVLADAMEESISMRGAAVLLLYSFVQTILNRGEQIGCLARASELVARNGLLFLECQNSDVAERVYPPNVESEWDAPPYRVISWSELVPPRAIRIHFAIKPLADLSACPICTTHTLMRMSPADVEEVVACVGGHVLEWHDAPQFSDVFYPEASIGMLAVVSFR